MGFAPPSKMRQSNRLMLRLQTDVAQDFLADVARGLDAAPKRIPPKYFYDAEGSALFERITETPEYYPTRTEAALLEQYGQAIVEAAGFPETVVELGSGSARKTRLLFSRLLRDGRTAAYIPIDISSSAITDLSGRLLTEFPQLRIEALVGDYYSSLDMLARRQEGRRLFLFLGSSLGNYDEPEARLLLTLVRKAMGPRDRLLLGLDQIKDPVVLNAAYNDAAGVTAAFNLNLLARINRELGGHFDLTRFQHVAFYDGLERRIEMHLESLMDQAVRVDALGRSFVFRRGERLHTENSYKYNGASLSVVLAGTGLRLERHWSDPRGWFTENLLAPE
jgi:L-histidine N-alpha-methyltransferase